MTCLAEMTDKEKRNISGNIYTVCNYFGERFVRPMKISKGTNFIVNKSTDFINDFTTREEAEKKLAEMKGK